MMMMIEVSLLKPIQRYDLFLFLKKEMQQTQRVAGLLNTILGSQKKKEDKSIILQSVLLPTIGIALGRLNIKYFLENFHLQFF